MRRSHRGKESSHQCRRTIVRQHIGRACRGWLGWRRFELRHIRGASRRAKAGGCMADTSILRTGENEGYSAEDILKSTGRGTILGSVTGTMSPLLGNVADRWVKATSNTAGKMGIRAGELATSTIAEGTIFSIPEWINGDGDAMDVWTDNYVDDDRFQRTAHDKVCSSRRCRTSPD